MRAFASSFCAVAAVVASMAIGCDGTSANRTITVDVGTDQTVRTEVSCDLPGGGSERIVSVAVWRYGERVEVQLTPVGGYELSCVSVCVSGLSGDSGECTPWTRIERGSEGSFIAEIHDPIGEIRYCAPVYHVHIRMHGAACSTGQ